MTNWKDFINKHIFGFAVAAVLVFCGRLALQEHDARLRAEDQVKTAEANVKSLQDQQKTVTTGRDTKLIVLRTQAAEVNTPAKAIQALPSVAPEIQPEALPDAPERVSVKAEPLFQDLNQAAQDRVSLKACEDNLSLQKQIDAEKDKEVKAESGKPGFWHRLGKAGKAVACAGAGAAVGGMTKSPQGAAVGAVAAEGLCQMF